MAVVIVLAKVLSVTPAAIVLCFISYVDTSDAAALRVKEFVPFNPLTPLILIKIYL